jgi:VWFA-related protein
MNRPGRFGVLRLAVAAAVVGGTLLRAQAPAAPPPPESRSPDGELHPGLQRAPRTLRSSVEVTTVAVTVRDADGHLSPGLPREAFTVFEDGEPQAITQFTDERVPVGVGLLLDVSDSMFGARIRDARAAVERFLLELLSPADAFFVTAFNHRSQLLTAWTGQPDTIRAALETLHPSGATAIYDAVLGALPMLDRRPRDRAALVIISDGADTASDATLRDVRAALVRSDAFVYAIAIDSPSRMAINARVNPEALAEITTQSGGRTEVVHDTAELGAATGRIAEELNTQYVIGYSSPHPGDGKYHSIRVKVDRVGYRVRARNGYLSVPTKHE